MCECWEANVEGEFQEYVENAVNERFGVGTEVDTYVYVWMRYELVMHFKKKQYDFYDFVKDTLGLSCEITYKGVKLSEYYMPENSYKSAVDNFYMRMDMLVTTGESDIVRREETLIGVVERLRSEFRGKKKRRKRESEYRKLLDGLRKINQYFNVSDGGIEDNVDVSQKDSRFTFEEICEMEIEAERIQGLNGVEIAESDVREYLKTRLDMLEPGMKCIGVEVPVGEGYVDLLARDREGKLVIIELKVKDDKKVIWQALYYPKELMKLRKEEDSRFILITPELSDSVKEVLEELGSVEVVLSELTVGRGNVLSVKLN